MTLVTWLPRLLSFRILPGRVSVDFLYRPSVQNSAVKKSGFATPLIHTKPRTNDPGNTRQGSSQDITGDNPLLRGIGHGNHCVTSTLLANRSTSGRRCERSSGGRTVCAPSPTSVRRILRRRAPANLRASRRKRSTSSDSPAEQSAQAASIRSTRDRPTNLPFTRVHRECRRDHNRTSGQSTLRRNDRIPACKTGWNAARSKPSGSCEGGKSGRVMVGGNGL